MSLGITIKIAAHEHSVTVGGEVFQIPQDSAQRAGLRELVVNHWCLRVGLPVLYAED